MIAELQTLIDLQDLDTRIARLETDAARLPKQLDAITAAVAEAGRTLEALRGRSDTTRKDLRTKEKDLEVTAGKRAKAESRLYEVKTNKEYSAVLLEIEEIKQEKARTEEEILALMEQQERLAVEVREAEARLKTREEKVLRLRFGLSDGCEHTLEEVGQDFAVTRERIRQIEAKALRKLRHPSRSKKLRSFLES